MVGGRGVGAVAVFPVSQTQPSVEPTMKPAQEVLPNPTSLATVVPHFQPAGLPAWSMSPVQTFLLKEASSDYSSPHALSSSSTAPFLQEFSVTPALESPVGMGVPYRGPSDSDQDWRSNYQLQEGLRTEEQVNDTMGMKSAKSGMIKSSIGQILNT